MPPQTESRQQSQQRSLPQILLSTTWLFQLIIAGPIFIYLGLAAIFNLFYTFDRAYDFITHLFTSLFAAGIFFIVLVQRKLAKTADGGAGPGASRGLTLRFEVAKAVLATADWLWLMLDAIFGPADHYYSYRGRNMRIVTAAVSVVLLFVLFYPTVYFVKRDEKFGLVEEDAGNVQEQGEREPLLGEQRAV